MTRRAVSSEQIQSTDSSAQKARCFDRVAIDVELRFQIGSVICLPATRNGGYFLFAPTAER